MEDKLSSLQQELEQIKTKYQELQQVFDRERAAWADDRKLLEGTIVDMSTSEKHSEENKNKWEQDLKAQEQRARVCYRERINYWTQTNLCLPDRRGSLLE